MMKERKRKPERKEKKEGKILLTEGWTKESDEAEVVLQWQLKRNWIESGFSSIPGLATRAASLQSRREVH